MTQPKIARKLRTAQIEIAIMQAQIFVAQFLIERKWQRLGAV